MAYRCGCGGEMRVRGGRESRDGPVRYRVCERCRRRLVTVEVERIRVIKGVRDVSM